MTNTRLTVQLNRTASRLHDLAQEAAYESSGWDAPDGDAVYARFVQREERCDAAAAGHTA